MTEEELSAHKQEILSLCSPRATLMDVSIGAAFWYLVGVVSPNVWLTCDALVGLQPGVLA